MLVSTGRMILVVRSTSRVIDPWIAIKTLAFSSIRMTCFICKVGGSHTWRGIFNTTQCDQMTCVIIPVIVFLCEDKKSQLQTLWYSVKYQKLKLAPFIAVC